MEPVASGGTARRVRVMLPLALLCGSTRIVYVPVAGSVLASMEPPDVPTVVGGARAVPSGFAIETLVLQQLDGPIVTPPSSSATRCPAVPSKLSLAFSPGVVVVTVTGGGPASRSRGE